MTPMIPYGRQTIDDADEQAVLEVLRSDWLTTGPKVQEFEKAFAEVTGARHAVAVSNGTAALHAAAFAAEIGEGDEVIVPPMTFAASANCVRYQNGTVVFADVDPHTLLLDPARVKAAITPRTRAIIAVDYTGQPADLAELRAIADEYKLILIEDAAHSLGATYRDRRVGTIADLTTFSLHPVKHITTGEGGVITTNDDALAQRLRLFRNHGINSDHRQREEQGSWFYEMLDLGYNYRLTDIQCALGIAQLRHLPEWVARRRAIAARYDEAFAALPLDPIAVKSERDPSWHPYVIQLRLEELRADRATIFQTFRQRGLGVNVHYIPVHFHPYYQRLGWKKGDFPIAEAAYERLITLPLFPAMRDEDVERVIDVVTSVLTESRR
ncbi:MAG TPA: UDP-4-amino-4,6-dideoxy-N-acetyl-beta-L-altrosamine transaminase [Thermoanaerobaculia bacterium]